MHFRATAAPPFSLFSSLFALPHRTCSSDSISPITTRHSHPQSRAFHSLDISSLSCLDRRPSHMPVAAGITNCIHHPSDTLMCVSLWECHSGFIFIGTSLNSCADSNSALHLEDHLWQHVFQQVVVYCWSRHVHSLQSQPDRMRDALLPRVATWYWSFFTAQFLTLCLARFCLT